MAETPNRFLEEAREVAAVAHGAARDDRDARQDGLTDRLLRMYEKSQDAMQHYMRVEGDVVRDIKDGLARVEKQVADFVKAFPDGDATLHRIAHEAQIKAAKDNDMFWGRIKFTLVALALTAVTGWIGIVVWRAFLLGPK